jgi:hypothetical protein
MALVALHGFWLMTISLVAGLAVGFLSFPRLRQLAFALLGVGFVGLMALMAWAVVTWRTGYGDMTAAMFGRRFIYLLAILTDLPIVQCGLAGAVLLVVAQWSRGRTGRRAERLSEDAQRADVALNGKDDGSD